MSCQLWGTDDPAHEIGLQAAWLYCASCLQESLGARRDKGWPREGCSWKVVESDCSKLQHSGSRKTLSSLGWWSSLADIGCRWSLEGFVEESVVLVSCGCFAAHLTNHLAHKAFTSARYPCTWINAFLVKGTAAFQGGRICRDLCPQPGDHEHCGPRRLCVLGSTRCLDFGAFCQPRGRWQWNN